MWFLRIRQDEKPHTKLTLTLILEHTHISMHLSSPLQFLSLAPFSPPVNPQTYQTTKGAVGRSGKKVLRSPNLDDLAVAEHGDAVRDLDGRPPMSNEEGRSALRVKKEGRREGREEGRGCL